MPQVNLSLEIHCDRPSWINSGYVAGNPVADYSVLRQPTYRLYINDDLITERTWYWEDSIYINEDVWVDLPEGIEHKLSVEPVLRNPAQAKFLVFNVQAKTGALKNKQRINDLQFSFNI
jgi:hypothetical protein